MVVFRKMMSKDKKNVYYFLASETQGFLRIYTKDIAELNSILITDDFEEAKQAVKDFFTSLLPLRYEKARDEYIPNLTPVPTRFVCLELPYFQVNERRKRVSKAVIDDVEDELGIEEDDI